MMCLTVSRLLSTSTCDFLIGRGSGGAGLHAHDNPTNRRARSNPLPFWPSMMLPSLELDQPPVFCAPNPGTCTLISGTSRRQPILVSAPHLGS